MMFPRGRARRIHRSVLWLSFLSIIVQPARAANFSEDQIKAVYLFNFAEFIRWPESTFSEHPDTFHFCALNEDNSVILNLKKVIAGEKVKGRKLVFQRINDLHDLKGCQVLYIQNDELSQYDELSSRINNSGVLSVSDQDDFVTQGGMIAISRVRNRLRPTINIRRLKQAGLKASAKLLRLAIIVDGG